jgi:N2-acetyl-L-2,4-diaminobutanoate deacetylase
MTGSPDKRRTAFCTIDLDKPGKQIGWVMLPHSTHDDAWGVTRVPIAAIGNGNGPTVILEGGNHGDEYEGPIAISDLARELDPTAVQGRLILMPANNVHAVMAGTRTSPIDGLNLNRTFPGDALGSITQQISDFVANEIFPRGNAFLDLHSGGSSLDLLPSTVIEPTADPELHRRNLAAAQAFGAPFTVVIGNYGDPRTATATACAAGLTTVGTELGGSGTVRLENLALCRSGIRRVLTHLGVIGDGSPHPLPEPAASLLAIAGPRAFVYATTDGVFEPYHPNGQTVQAGEAAGRIHRVWEPAQEPVTLHYQSDGIVSGRGTAAWWSLPPMRVLSEHRCRTSAGCRQGAAAIRDARRRAATRPPAARDHA